MITALEAIEQANNAAGIRTLAFANIQEAQSFMDSFRFEEYPVNIVVPFTFNGTTNLRTGLKKSTIPLQGWVLTRINSDPMDYRSRQAEELYISPMRLLAKKFIRELLKTDIIDPEVDTITDTITPEYLFLNMLSFGVSYQVTVPIQDNVC